MLTRTQLSQRQVLAGGLFFQEFDLRFEALGHD